MTLRSELGTCQKNSHRKVVALLFYFLLSLLNEGLSGRDLKNKFHTVFPFLPLLPEKPHPLFLPAFLRASVN